MRTLLARALRRCCPECGGRGIFKKWIFMHDRCPRCGYEFARESGYFLGSQSVNLVGAEIVPVGLMIGFFIWTDFSWILLEAILLPLAVFLPFLFYPYACTIWMGIDLYLTPVNQR